jgi:hypothetical protein
MTKPSRIRSVRLEDDVYNALKAMSERPYTPSWHIQEALRQYLAGKAPKEISPKKPKAVDDYQFEGMWEAYGKKGNKKTSRAKFNKLDILDQNLIYDHIPIYVLSTPDKQYRKNFETYLNQECWNDEVITNGQQNQPGRTTEGRKLSPAERSRAAAEANRAARARDRGDLDNVAGDIRQLNGDPIRGCDAGVVGTVIEGDYTKAD